MEHTALALTLPLLEATIRDARRESSRGKGTQGSQQEDEGQEELGMMMGRLNLGSSSAIVEGAEGEGMRLLRDQQEAEVKGLLLNWAVLNNAIRELEEGGGVGGPGNGGTNALEAERRRVVISEYAAARTAVHGAIVRGAGAAATPARLRTPLIAALGLGGAELPEAASVRAKRYWVRCRLRSEVRRCPTDFGEAVAGVSN